MFGFTLFCFLLIDVILSETDFITIQLNENVQCVPNKIYKYDNKTCICTNDGTWPSQECVSILDSGTRKENCDPNKYTFVDCNVCLCGPDGKINKNHCSQHNCVGLNKTRRSSPILGQCEPKKFYELVPCQFCYCINKFKLVCTNSPKNNQVKIGHYNLNNCGGNLIRDLNYLLPEKNTGKSKKRSGKKHKKVTTVIHLDESNKNDLGELTDSGDKYSYPDINKHSNSENTIVNNRNQQSFEETNYDKEDSEVPKAITSDASNGYSAEIDKRKKSSNTKPKKSNLDPIAYVSGLINERNISDPIIIDVPSVLDKVLNLVLRKSMISLKSGNNCAPGDKIKDKCNTCYCLVNGKMLCTKNTCE